MPPKHQLAQLIDSVKAANNWSDPRLVRNAEEQKHELSKSNISRIRKPVVSIKGELILALAAGLRVSPAQVATAALESMGIPLVHYELPTPEQAVRLDTQLSERDKQAVLALLRQLRGSASESDAPPSGQGQEGLHGPKGPRFPEPGSGKGRSAGQDGSEEAE